MANLQETSTWEAGIYQLETSDPVMGGENGIDNRAPRQLANRTLWLKNELARQIGVVNTGKLGKTENAVSASKLATARNIAMTGDGSWNVNFDGSQNATGAMTLANSGVTAGSYNSVTVDAKGRVTAGLTQTHGLVTATTATGTTNVATGNGNTFLNIVASGVGQTASVGSSTQITGTNGITVSSDTAGKLIVGQVLANSLTDTSTAKALTANMGKVLDEKISALDNRATTLRGQLGTTDLNTLTAAAHTGIWYQENNSNATTERNYPVARSGILFVLPSVWQGQQLYFPYNENALYTRHINNSNSWSAWYKIGETINNLTSTSTTASLSANQGKVLNETKLDKAGGMLTGAISMPTSVTSMPANTAFAISYGRMQGYSNLYINANTDNSGDEAVIITSGKGLSANKNDGLAVGSNYLTWLGAAVATVNSNVATATKLATARQIALTGDGTGQANFDGSANANIALTLANSGVTAGSYNSVTVDAKGRVTAGLTQTHGLVTATNSTGTTNVATGNGNTFLNIVASGVGQTASVGSSTQITGTNGIGVSSDTAGKLIITQSLANSLTDTATNKALTALQGKTLNDTKLDKTGGEVSGEIISTNANAYRLKSANKGRSVILRSDGDMFYLLKTADQDPDGNWDTTRPFVWDLRSNAVTLNGNATTATKLQTTRQINLTGAVTGRVNFDGSANVNIATTLTKAVVRDYNRTVTGTATNLLGSASPETIQMTGKVVVGADGLIKQYFHLKHFKDIWFGRDDNAVGYQNHDIANYKIPIALWTAMPNKVLSVQAQTMRSSDIASSAQFSSEAAEHEVAWAFRNQGIDKSNVWLNLSRMHGGASEHIDLFVIVEGY